MTKELPLYLVKVRVFITNKNGEYTELERFVSPSVPRQGEYYSVHAWDLEIYKVSWVSINHIAQADLFLDGANFLEWLNSDNKSIEEYLKLKYE